MGWLCLKLREAQQLKKQHALAKEEQPQQQQLQRRELLQHANVREPPQKVVQNVKQLQKERQQKEKQPQKEKQQNVKLQNDVVVKLIEKYVSNVDRGNTLMRSRQLTIYRFLDTTLTKGIH